MKYELERHESPADGIRRIILERVDYVYDLMTRPAPTRETAVHQARKSFKRIRAALRLVRDEIGQDWYRRENIFYRDASRLLAAVRDSTVMVLTLGDVTDQFAHVVAPQEFDSIRFKLLARHERIAHELLDEQDVLATVAGLMAEGRPRIEETPIGAAGFAAFDNGLRRVYRRGRRALELTLADPDDPVKFHQWRKRVKYLWYHMDILRPAWPVMLHDTARELHIVSDFLGDAHDLVQLKATLLSENELFAAENNLVALLALIDRRRSSLERASWTLGQRLYYERPREFVGRIGAYWDAWQADLPATSEALQKNAHSSDIASAQEVADGAQLLSTRQVAERLGTTARKVRADIRGGQLQASKVGRFWVIAKDNLPPDEHT